MTAKFIPNPGNVVSPQLRKHILQQYAALHQVISKGFAFLEANHDDKNDGRMNVEITMEDFDCYPEVLWFNLDILLGKKRVLVECFPLREPHPTAPGYIKDHDCLIDLGIVVE